MAPHPARRPSGLLESPGDTTGEPRVETYFGRRIEADRTWTIYHVYTGVPASAAGRDMIGMSLCDATAGMQLLNRRDCACASRTGNARAGLPRGLSAFLRAAWRRTGGISWH